MMFDPLSLANPGVQGLRPYQPGKPLQDLEREYGITRAIKLASNENPLGPSAKALRAIAGLGGDLARYPDGNGFRLKMALASHLGVETNSITLGNGSNDILELLTRAFVRPEHEVIFSAHAFAVYPIVTQAVGAGAVVTPAKDWGYDLDAIKDAITAATRLIFIANPNNPTGTWLGNTALKALLDDVPGHVMVVLDEAYCEYVEEPDYPNSLPWLGDYPNLVITRTFSKIYGLAGLRVGYSVSSPAIADILNRVRQPFNVNSMGLAAAEAALGDQGHVARSISSNTAGLRQYETGTLDLGLDYIPSVANFIAVDLGRPALPIYEALLHKGVIVRPVANYAMPNHLRITVGTQEDNRAVLDALAAVLSDLK